MLLQTLRSRCSKKYAILDAHRIIFLMSILCVYFYVVKGIWIAKIVFKILPWTFLIEQIFFLSPPIFLISLQWRPQAIVFELVTNKKFDMIIMLFIGLNMLTMTLDHYQQTPIFTLILDYLNMIFIAIFSTECLMKIFALRYHYFVEPWNLFDVVVVVLSILST